MWDALLGWVGLLPPPDGKPAGKRSGRWRQVRELHLLHEPMCQACGSRTRLEVHHILPFQLWPERELDPDNLITLCEGEVVNCHFMVGHLRNWKSWNPEVRADAETWMRKVRNRPMADMWKESQEN
jgi:5-methylcytosine-specific restriction protein A